MNRVSNEGQRFFASSWNLLLWCLGRTERNSCNSKIPFPVSRFSLAVALTRQKKKKKTQRSIFNMLNHIGNFDITTDGFLEFKTTHRLILQEGSLVCFPYSWRRYFFRMVRSLQPTAATLLYPKFWRHLWDPIYMILVSSRTVSVKQEREATI